jgi:hypothetical protein
LSAAAYYNNELSRAEESVSMATSSSWDYQDILAEGDERMLATTYYSWKYVSGKQQCVKTQYSSVNYKAKYSS